MSSPFEAIAKELFKRQISFEKGRYELKVPLGPSERLNWIGSKHWALLENTMYKKFGADYFLYDYYVGKLWGHIFSSKISSLVKTQRVIALVIGTIVEQLGFGKVEHTRHEYGADWGTYELFDSPVAREWTKLFGQTKFPVDYAIAGLTAGTAEQVLKRKFATIETSCIAQGDDKCVFHSVGLETFKKMAEKKAIDPLHKKMCEMVLEMEKKTDFINESKKLIENQNEKAIWDEKNYLKK